MEPLRSYPLELGEAVRQGEVRSLFRGPRTVAEILEDARDEMKLDEPRPRRLRLIDVLRGR